jgi:pimeloyl-ACP methyl ester carboxylesterase
MQKLSVSLVLAVVLCFSSTHVTTQSGIEGDWRGILDAGVAKLQLILHVTRNGDVLSATLDSPDQGATGLKIDSISVTANEVHFEMQALGAEYHGKFTKDGSEIEGQFRQQGQSLSLSFSRAERTGDSTTSLKLQKVNVDGHALNLLIGGQGSPAVILEGGFGAGIASWSTIQKDVAAFTQTVSYDRAGLGQSEAGPKPRSAKQIASELHTALQNAGIKPPYVLVGHSLGGIFVRVFADLYPTEVKGMVLIDPSQEAFEEWTKTHPSPNAKNERAQMEKASEGVRAEGEAVPLDYAQARASKIPSGIPVTLLSATEDEAMPAEARKVWIEKHKEWIAKVPGGKHVVVERSRHFIQLQHPQVVIDAIKEAMPK